MGELISFADFKDKPRKPHTSAPTNAPSAVTAAGIFNDVIMTHEGVEYFDYNVLVHDALLSLVRRALQIVEKKGLPRGSKLFFQLNTQAPGFEMSERLRTRFPAEIPILLDAWWEDLVVTDGKFAVTLNFSDVKERLTVPFTSILFFRDHGNDFWLKFNKIEMELDPTPPEVA